MKAIWNNKIIAESEDIVGVEGMAYFPSKSVKMEYLHKNGDTYVCSWKGTCDYYDVEVDGKTASGAAFIYPEPEDAAKEIAGRIAFWKGVKLEK